MKQKVVNNSHALRWRLIAFTILLTVLATLFTLFMLGYLGSPMPLANLLAREGEEQKPFGWLHLVSLACLFVLIFVLLKFGGHANDRQYRLILFVGWLILVIFELLKQFSNYYYYNGKTFVIGYIWDAFPFQFCSLVYYVLPFVFLLNDGKVRDATEMFFAEYVVFGGLVNMIYPSTVLSINCFLNVQTMVHHGALIALSIYIAYYRRDKLDLKHFLPSIIVLLIAIAIAVILNETIYHVVPEVHEKVNDQCFNMFFISPYFPTAIIVFKSLQPLIPNAVFIMLYAIGFIIVAYVIFILYSLAINHQIKPCLAFKTLFVKESEKSEHKTKSRQ